MTKAHTSPEGVDSKKVNDVIQALNALSPEEFRIVQESVEARAKVFEQLQARVDRDFADARTKEFLNSLDFEYSSASDYSDKNVTQYPDNKAFYKSSRDLTLKVKGSGFWIDVEVIPIRAYKANAIKKRDGKKLHQADLEAQENYKFRLFAKGNDTPIRPGSTAHFDQRAVRPLDPETYVSIESKGIPFNSAKFSALPKSLQEAIEACVFAEGAFGESQA